MKKTVICLTLMLMLLPAIAFADSLRVTFIDVGDGDAALVQCGGQAMLIDTGNVSSQEALLAFLDRAGVIALDYVVGTHPNDDHIGGIAAVLGKYDVQSIWMPRVRNETKAFDDALLTIKQTGHLIDPPVAGNEIKLGDAVVTILAPISDVYERLEDYSIVLRIDHGKNSFLFTGDASQVSIDEMLASNANLSASVLKVNNHGAAIPNMQAFLSSVTPSIAVISCGPEQTPAIETLELLARSGARILRTDERGDIRIESDRTSLFDDEKVALGQNEWYGRINTKDVNVRKGASRTEDRVAYLDIGTAVRVLLPIENDIGETWYLVDIDGLQGYIRSDFVDPANPLAGIPGEGEATPSPGDDLDEYFRPKPSSGTETDAPLSAWPDANTPEPAVSAHPTIPVAKADTEITLPPVAPQNTQTPIPQPQEEPTYIGNVISKIFHQSTCDSLPSSKNRITFSTRNEAISEKYIPCLACKP